MTLDEMWKRLAQHQPFADRRGYGPEWARMVAKRTEEAAWAARDAARAAAKSAAWAAEAAAEAAKAAAAKAAAAWAEAVVTAWQSFDPCSVLEKLIEVQE